MAKQLYFECASGISGDMTVAALLDLGASERVLLDTLATLPIEEPYEIRITRVEKSGLDACDFLVELPGNEEFRDHDMEYLHGHGGDHGQEPVALHNPSHGTHHHGRTPAQIGDIFERSGMTQGAKDIAFRILDVLAKAEAAVHGKDISQVHFHEAGATDSIIDIASVAICLDNIWADGVIVTELSEGHGSVRCQHGLLPIPVPAVTQIASEYGLKFHFLPVEGELVTPTGAAIVAAVATSDQLPSQVKIRGCGLGAGKRSYDVPEVLRIFLLETETEEETDRDQIWKLETNIDDCTGEVLGYVMDRLFDAGARDVSYLPVFMKKNRPAYELHVICEKQDVPRMDDISFRGTTTIGIRKRKMERSILPREVRVVETSLGKARVKICRIGDEIKVYPEYDSASALAREHGLPLEQVFCMIRQECSEIEF